LVVTKLDRLERSPPDARDILDVAQRLKEYDPIEPSAGDRWHLPKIRKIGQVGLDEGQPRILPRDDR
jgi:hypothetical protein